MDFNDVFDLFQIVTRHDDADAAEGRPAHPRVLQHAQAPTVGYISVSVLCE